MASQYADEQPTGSKNFIENVAIIGAGGNIGRHIADALISGKKHKVTAITRPNSNSTLPSSLHEIKKSNYDDHATLVEALKGQQALVIIMGVFAPPDTQLKIVNAAVEAGVSWIMPAEFGSDQENVKLGEETMLGPGILAVRKHIEETGNGKTHWIGISSGFWYEFSLSGRESRYGFDFKNKTLTLFDDGNEKIITTTWPQTGRVYAALLSLPILPKNANDKKPCLSMWKNKAAYISSFLLSQRDMIASVLRVLSDKESDRTVSQEDAKKGYGRGMKMLQEGNMEGFNVQLYTRMFFPSGEGDFSSKLDNTLLELPEESLDEATNVAIEIAKSDRA